MGRFGNQGEQLLGSLLFAKHLNRTLVLPPFIEYKNFEVMFASFDKYIEVEPISIYTRVVTMEIFMESIAPNIWRPDDRVIMCYKSRGTQNEGCNPFEGNPFKPFWFHFNITHFKSSEFHHPLSTSFEQAQSWNERYKNFKVLTFVGAPSPFPTAEEAVPLAEYINLSSLVKKMAMDYRESRGFARKPYLALHLRHGSDWIQACKLLKENAMSEFFSSQQCTAKLGREARISLPYELCNPSFKTIVDYLSEALNYESNVHKIETVYIATDSDNKKLWEKLKRSFKNITFITPTTTYGTETVKKYKPPHYIVDIYLMTYSNFFIGNCISSFTAFASRIRTFNLHLGKATKFFGEMLLYENYNFVKDEL
ncbi:GDP-fucose protein O-fucosyltransferase 1-like protein [Dinothrombium tinctorium]|uniref:GDP-fucose protein O-fucosyltransferase 1 n=1 Tax=Dinothrombium tinctorium TaxID=1965070 RepID=A0A3S3PBH0_9ACAR|nr:GDP-fucose protein O-fucosyltransferase 1-like protein [Dinothrombium tinctorium]RWS09150.1 GDP-fucose protein O-fucosyltransferase 1-like protein [Dinothrombium tinctorium]